jgi:iron complex outermembrane receptor protein
VQVFVPIGQTIGSDSAVIAMIDRNRDSTKAIPATPTTPASQASNGQDRYRVYTNARDTYTTYGSSLGLTYNFFKTYTISGNINYNVIKTNAQPDLFVTGFNTPRWASNLSFGNRAVTKSLGFNVVYHWQDSYLWESPLVTSGQVAAINNIDAQITWLVPSLKSAIKFGGTNIFNNRYIQYAGGPTIGALYYVAITLDGLLNK